jgi:hypothetical protein
VEIVATHQQHIALIITQILALSDDTLTAFSRGNPFDKLLRSYDEFTADGKGLYRRKLGSSHYRYSKSAYSSGLYPKMLFGEHRIPLSLISRQLMNSDRKLSTVELILRSNEVVLITKEEERKINASEANGGFALKSKIAPSGECRLAYCGIEIAPETLSNHL